ncbi:MULTISPECIES: hypothetical protein [unclassified Streptomyces]|uniref:hypothetical protein n=1 Tax=unclassified Streptomyces TaxID=2593676 RepID=UPI0021BDB4A0|nr:hypothetical protein [Streptomyces sp. BK340]
MAACTAHWAGRYPDRHGLSRDGLTVRADFRTADDRPARVAALSMTVSVPVPAGRATGRDACGGLPLHGEQHTGRCSRGTSARTV